MSLADRLLDAHVEFLVDELTNADFPQVVARDVASVFAVADTLSLSQAVNAEALKAAIPEVIEHVNQSEIVPALVLAIADTIYTLPEADDHLLNDTVDPDEVSKIVEKVLKMRESLDRVLEHISESPLVATVAQVFMNKLVADVLQENKQKAEKIPGVGAALAFGGFAASRLKSVGGGALDNVLGDMQKNSGAYAVKKTNAAIKEVVQDAPVHGAAMEIWNLHGVEPMSDLRKFISQNDLRELADLIHTVVRSTSNKPYTLAAINASIDTVFEKYGDEKLGAILRDLGATEQQVASRIEALGPQLLAAAKESGQLADLVRTRVEPFYRSAAFAAAVESA